MEKKYIKSVGIVPTGMKSGVCGNWSALDGITTDDQNIFQYLKGFAAAFVENSTMQEIY
jgi:hypothetical protein